MSELAWITLALAVFAAMQSIGTITNAIELHKRRKVAQDQLDLDREKFNYNKNLDIKK